MRTWTSILNANTKAEHGSTLERPGRSDSDGCLELTDQLKLLAPDLVVRPCLNRIKQRVIDNGWSQSLSFPFAHTGACISAHARVQAHIRSTHKIESEKKMIATKMENMWKSIRQRHSVCIISFYFFPIYFWFFSQIKKVHWLFVCLFVSFEHRRTLFTGQSSNMCARSSTGDLREVGVPICLPPSHSPPLPLRPSPPSL